MAFRQCPKRLWLELHQPQLREDSLSTVASYKIGNDVGKIARQIYDPENRGVLINVEQEGFEAAFNRSKELLKSAVPIFEAGFSAAGVLAFADVMLPAEVGGVRAWKMIEVKSTSSVKDHFHDDIAIQVFAARAAGVLIKSVSLAHIDTSWTYQGDGNYHGLLKEHDFTDTTLRKFDEVKSWIAEANVIASRSFEPEVKVGKQCKDPYDCGFYSYCTRHQPKAEYPVQWLPGIRSQKVENLAAQGIYDLREIPDEMLNEKQIIVKQASITNKAYVYQFALSSILANLDFPLYFLDFETISFAVPIWDGTHPFQQIPFQFSLHKLTESGELTHIEFLDISGNNSMEAFANALVNACGREGDIIVYNQSFEKNRIQELSEKFPNLSDQLLSINKRIEDLYPIAKEHYYHPSQQGSWSLKKLVSAVIPELKYEDLSGIQNGNMAMDAYREAMQSETTVDRKEVIKQELLAYCNLDTFALVRIWQVFSGYEEMRALKKIS